MVPETYTDGIGWIGLSEGMIRIEFVSHAPPREADAQQPITEVRQRIIMTPQTFLRSVVAQQRVVAKLQEAGLVKRLPERNAPESSSNNDTGAGAIPGPPRSPNFPSD
jgi:hypothetical protein